MIDGNMKICFTENDDDDDDALRSKNKHTNCQNFILIS